MKKLLLTLTLLSTTLFAEVKPEGTILAALQGKPDESSLITSVEIFSVSQTPLVGLTIKKSDPNGFERLVVENYIVVARQSYPKYEAANGEVQKATLELSVVPATTKSEGQYTLLDAFSYKAPQKLLKIKAVAKTLDTESLDGPYSLVDAVLISEDETLGKFKVSELEGVMHTEGVQ